MDFTTITEEVMKISFGYGDTPLFIERGIYDHIELDHEITDEEFINAVRVIFTKMVQDKMNYEIINLPVFDRKLRPPVKMTMEDIEKALGYKFEIVKEH